MGEYSKGTIERRNRCFAVGLPLFVLAVIMLMAAVNVRASDTRTVTGTKNYLALRSSAKYSDKRDQELSGPEVIRQVQRQECDRKALQWRTGHHHRRLGRRLCVGIRTKSGQERFCQRQVPVKGRQQQRQ